MIICQDVTPGLRRIAPNDFRGPSRGEIFLGWNTLSPPHSLLLEKPSMLEDIWLPAAWGTWLHQISACWLWRGLQAQHRADGTRCRTSEALEHSTTGRWA